MIDLHCHLLPYVDDGANDLDEARKLLTMEAEQGVREVNITPHLRQGMFETPDEVIQRQFERLCRQGEANNLTLHVSREYHIDGVFWEKLKEGSILPIGKNTILAEFSSQHSAEQILVGVERILEHGYTSLIAHVERYPAATVDVIGQLRFIGALIQVNVDSVLGYDGRAVKRFSHSLLKSGLVDVIASDAHSTDFRPPRLRECQVYLARKFSAELAEKLLQENPKKIITGE